MELPCIWMSAGLVRYKLCSRGFDCEHCPLDAGLRGDAVRLDDVAPTGGEITFPVDRRYSPGHCWVRPEGGGTARVGLDGLAAALAGPVRGVRPLADGGPLAQGAPLCRLELASGALPLAAPLPARSIEHNPALERAPYLAGADPYGDGWLAQLEGAPEAADLWAADEARTRARLDVRHFRRRAALCLLSDADGVGSTLADGGERITDLRGMLGAPLYLALVRELVR